MIETELANRWAALPDFVNRVGSWMWFRDAVRQCIDQIARRNGVRCELRWGLLAEAFFEWAANTDTVLRFAEVDPIDYGHFATGALLGSLVRASPITMMGAASDRVPVEADSLFRDLLWHQDLVLLMVVLTLLQAWRLHHGGEALSINQSALRRSWNSFHENVKEDGTTAVPFLDLFLGLPADFQDPMDIAKRPAMARAQSHG